MQTKEHEKLMKSLEDLEVKEFGVERYGTELRKPGLHIQNKNVQTPNETIPHNNKTVEKVVR